MNIPVRLMYSKAKATLHPYILAFVMLSVFLTSCNREKKSAIARAYNTYLYEEDIEGLVKPGTNRKDSLNSINTYIENWQRDQTILYHAQKQINKNPERFNKQIEEYKSTLIIHEFEDSLIQKKLDTTITENEIKAYYEEYQDIFVLKRPIFKVSYIQLAANAPEIERVKRWFQSNDLDDQSSLQQYCESYSSSFSLNDTSWYYLDELKKKMPIEQIDENNYRNYGRIFEINEKNQIYLIVLQDSKLRNSISPLDIERENIKKLLINQRKIEILRNEERSLIERARQNNHIETYSK